LANAWAGLRELSGNNRSWEWEQEEMEKEIIHLRMALHGIDALSDERACQILTNLGNLMDHIGRFVEAIEYWDEVLDTLPSFPMARGNRGLCLPDYARALYDPGHAGTLLKCAHADLKIALLSSELYEDARKCFDECRIWIESVLSSECIEKDIDMNGFSLGASQQEVQYRKWCLDNRLFLNPLNDLGPYPIAARDVFTAPSIVVGIGDGPYYPGYFNQMKQEFVSARYLYYDGINADQPHFSDRDVLLYNTLDYPAYSLAVESVKAAFRIAYSLFDKIAYFLNDYLDLAISERQVSFRTFWYEKQKTKRGLKPIFQKRENNWPLRGLFWLSKDLFEDKLGFKESIEPDAQELADIRNHLEHKYLKLHDEFWQGTLSVDDRASSALADTLAFSIHRREFEVKTLKLIKMVRSALIYLSLAIHAEEKQRRTENEHKTITPKVALDIFEDDWKL
jgi:tetratricopeptide (TPR) repeat protein